MPSIIPSPHEQKRAQRRDRQPERGGVREVGK
jgi:hypothetical protein